jgi:hypothetical protein
MLPGADRSDGERLAAAHARRDLAVEGYRALFRPDGSVDPDRLARLHERAVALVAPRIEEWRERWRAGALAAAHDTGERLGRLAAGRDPGLADARVASTAAHGAFGMCGRLQRYDTQPAVPSAVIGTVPIPTEPDVPATTKETDA